MSNSLVGTVIPMTWAKENMAKIIRVSWNFFLFNFRRSMDMNIYENLLYEVAWAIKP